jgi:AcrR family transcriptional regulator
MDRRIARTRRVLRSALISLLRRKSYDDITVQDLISEADVGRSTFYAHCNGKEDLLRQGLQTLRVELLEAQRQKQQSPDHHARRPLSFSLLLFEHAASHKDIYPSLRSRRGGDVFMSEIRAVVLDLVSENLTRITFDETVPRSVTIQYVVGAFMALFGWWLERKAMHPPAEIDAMFQHLVMTGVAGRSSN